MNELRDVRAVGRGKPIFDILPLGIMIGHPWTGAKCINTLVNEIPAKSNFILARVSTEIRRIADVSEEHITPVAQSCRPVDRFAQPAEAIRAPIGGVGVVMVRHGNRSIPEEIRESFQPIQCLFSERGVGRCVVISDFESLLAQLLNISTVLVVCVSIAARIPLTNGTPGPNSDG